MTSHRRERNTARNIDTSLQAARVAARHYVDQCTNVEIAAEFGVSRFRVARLLEIARNDGIVRFSVSLPHGVEAELSERVRIRFGLDHCLVVGSDQSPEQQRDVLGRAAARLLQDLVTEDDVLGIAWGRTLSAMIRHVGGLPPAPVVQLTGVAGDTPGNAIELVRLISERTRGQAFPIYAPMVLPDGATLNGLLRQDSIAHAFQRHRHVTVAAVAVGSWDPPDSQLLQSLPPRSRQRLVRQGVRAEVCGTLISRDGSEVTMPDDHVLAISPQQLRRIPNVVAVAGGGSKKNAIRCVLSSGLVNSVITDEQVAQFLLDDAVPAGS